MAKNASKSSSRSIRVAGGKRREDRRAVTRRSGTSVQQRDETAIATATDEPSKALLQPHRRRRNHVVLEAVEPARFERANARHDERIAGRGKRQTVDDHARERVADDVDAFPKRRGRKEHGATACAGTSRAGAERGSSPCSRTGKASRSRNNPWTSRSRA